MTRRDEIVLRACISPAPQEVDWYEVDYQGEEWEKQDKGHRELFRSPMRGRVQRTRALYEELPFNNVAVVSHWTNPSGASPLRDIVDLESEGFGKMRQTSQRRIASLS